ncbi:MAG: gliding motility-associated C-terminal domain-containing protein [Bacteroidota bacterium]|nr:gliding motility-associated C-terminal domain-containing protein [Bacteroidota bacterium]
MQIKLREVQGNFAATDEALLGIGFAPDELTFKIWGQDNLGVYNWTGGSCLQDNNFTPTLGGTNSIDFNTVFANFSFPTNIVPQYIDLKIDAWEDDLPSDGLLGFCANGTSCTWQDMQCCGVYLFGFCVGIETGDDYRCDADPFFQGLTYRSGPPCQWYNHGYISGSGCNNPSSQPNAPNTDGYYKPRIETYWRYTKGTSFANSIDLGALGSGVLSHFNSNECYSNYYTASSGNDVIYSFSVTNPTGVNISLCGTNGAQFDSYLYLIKDTMMLNPFASNDNTCANQSEITSALCDVGTYYIVVDAKTATDLGTFTLTLTEDLSSAFTLTTSVSDASCNGVNNGQITSTINGGINPYTFEWYDISMNSLSPPNVTANSSDSLLNLAIGTYIVQVSDFNNCTLLDTVVVNQPNIISLNYTTVNPSCHGYSDGYSTVNIIGGTSPYSYIWNTAPVQNSSSAISLSAGSYTVTVVDANLCTDSVSILVENPSPVSVNILNNSSILCSGGSLNLSVSGANYYSWSPSIWLDTTIGSNVTTTPNSSISYIVTGTDTSGCSNTDTIDINVTPLLSIIATPANPIGCAGEDIYINLNTGLNTTYSWIPSFGVTVAGNGFFLNAQNSSTYNVIATDINGCIDSIEIPLTILPLPTVNITSASSICEGSSTQLIASGSNNYNWLPANGLSTSIGSVVTVSPLISTTFYVVGTAINGCSDTTNTTISVTPNPSFNVFPQNPSLCVGDTISLILDAGLDYLWSPNVGINNITSDSTLIFPMSSINYSILVSDSLGCSIDTNLFVTVFPEPLISIVASDDTICLNESSILTALGANSYIWYPSSSLNTNIGNVVSAMPSSDVTYTVTGLDINNCIASENITIIVNPLPLISVNPNQSTICEGENIQLIGSGANSYLWSPALGLNLTNSSTVVASPSITSSYFVTGTDINGCSDIVSSIINVNPLPPISVSPSNFSMCQGTSFNANVFGGVSYSWSPSYGLSDSIGSSVIVGPSSSIIYTISGTDINNCTNSTNLEVLVGSSPEIILFPESPQICEGESIMLSLTGAASYNWYPGNSLSASIGNIVSANPSVSTTYSVIGVDSLSCVDTIEFTLNVIPKPTASIFSNSGGIICSGDSASILINLSGNPPWDLTYTVNGAVQQTTIYNTPYEIFSKNSGLYMLNTVQDFNDCSNIATGSSSIEVLTTPIASFFATPQSTDIFNPEITFTNTSLFMDSCYWEFGDFTSSSEISPIKRYDNVGEYIINLIVLNEFCEDIVTEKIIINPVFSLYIPNSFTPSNFDGLNDIFLVKGIEEGIQDFQMYIYNRWGDQVFYTDNIHNGWNGLNLDKELLPIGTYEYIIFITDHLNSLRKIKGEILLQ